MRHRPVRGARYGEWVVLAEATPRTYTSPTTGVTSTHRRWRCRCSCGVVCTIAVNCLVRGESTRCVHCRHGLRRTGDAPFMARFKRGALKRKIVWSVTLAQFRRTFDSQGGMCALTGLPLTWPRGALDVSQCNHTASFDRIDSARGYTPDNVQWVHKYVNMLKGNRSDADLLHWARLIVAHADTRTP